jgi:hypothetical protein
LLAVAALVLAVLRVGVLVAVRADFVLVQQQQLFLKHGTQLL